MLDLFGADLELRRHARQEAVTRKTESVGGVLIAGEQ